MKLLVVILIFIAGLMACDTPQSTGISGTDSMQLDPNKSKVAYDTTMHRDTTKMQDSIPLP